MARNATAPSHPELVPHRSAVFQFSPESPDCHLEIEKQAKQCRENNTKWRDQGFGGNSSLFVDGETPPFNWAHHGAEIRFLRPEEFMPDPMLKVATRSHPAREALR